MFVLAFLLGAVVWFLTTVLVEGEIFREMRERIHHPKLAYLVQCHMCAGTWIGLAVGTAYPLPLRTNPVFARILSGLVYKAIAHLILTAHNWLERCSR